MSTPRRDERLDMRLPAEQKALIERAAALAGLGISAFALDAMVEKATRVIASHETTRLSARDWEAFLRAVDDERPNEALVAAVVRHRGG